MVHLVDDDATPAGSVIFSDLGLARRLERLEAFGGIRFVEARNRLPPETGASRIQVAGAYAVFDGPDSPVTQTFGPGLFEEATAAGIDKLESFFREHGAPVRHEVSPLAGVPVANLLGRRGYHPVEFTSVMYKPLPAGADSSGAANTLPRARLMAAGEEDFWSAISARRWSEHPEWLDFLRGFGRVAASSEGTLCLLGGA